MKPGKRSGVVMLLLCMACHSLVRAQMPQLRINDKEDPNVYLSKLAIDVKVAGTIATTTMEMTFSNKNNTLLEGELIIPLPAGISISRYALDLNGRMREAVPVEKEKATQVFEEIERRRVDPGLLERVEGNNFRTRIYPIPAHGTRTVLIAYEEELIATGKKGLRYHLPMDYKRPIDQFKLDIAVIQQAIKPDFEEEPDNDLQFKSWNNSYTATTDKQHFVPKHPLTITIPQPDDLTSVIMQETGGNYYFLATCFPQQAPCPKPRINEATLIWDASLSGLNRDIEKELALLDAYIRHNANLTIHLTTLNNAFRKAGTYEIKDGNWTALRKTLETLTYDGGTNFSRITYPASDEYLFFSDGLSSLSRAAMPLPGKPMYTVTTAPRADYAQLQYIAQKTGGTFVNLGALKTSEAAQLLTQQTLQFIGIKPNRAISETYPSIATPVINQFSLAGMVTSAATTVTLQFGYGRSVTIEKTIQLNFDKQATTQVNLGRVWAQKKIGELDVQYDLNKEMITYLGKQHAIVTRNTSLIVLETVEDYVRYEIEPPTELRDQYDRIIKQQLAVRENQRQITLSNALLQFNNLVGWWKQNFVAQKAPGKTTSDNPQALPRNRNNRVASDSVALPADDRSYHFTTEEREAAPARQRLEEVAVTGYGTQPRKAVAGSTPAAVSNREAAELQRDRTSVSNARRQATANKSAEEILTRVPGLQIDKDEEISQGLRSKNNPLVTSIDIKQWTPERTYLQTIAKEKAGNRYNSYLTLRKDYLYTLTFYYDMANFFFREQDTVLALQILTNMAEIDLENHELYKLLGYKLREAGAFEEALVVFRKVLEWRPQEPHSYRDYGLALADAGYYQQALDTLYTALQKNYNETANAMYRGIEEIIVTEINQLVSLHPQQLDWSRIDPKLIHAIPTDIRVVLNWNKNDTDMDLWVTDPNQETCYYSHKETLIGGRLSNDFTRGYGPEQFMLKKAVNGKYQVKVNYYGDQQFKFSGPTTVMAEIFTHYADGRQERRLITLQMEKGGRQEGILIGEFQFGHPPAKDSQAARIKK